MGNICSRKPKLNVLLNQEINKLKDTLPGVVCGLLISEDGKTVVASMTGEFDSGVYPNMLLPISAVRKSATLFGQTLQHYENKAIHIRAQQTTFSIYTVGHYTLNIYQELPSQIDENSDITMLDTDHLDQQVDNFRKVILELLHEYTSAT